MMVFFKKYKKIIIPISIFILITGGYYLFIYPKKEKPKFRTEIARRSNILAEVSVTGHIKPAESVELAFERSGKISAVYVEVGERVEAGKILATLDNSELMAQLKQAEAMLENSETQLKQYQAVLMREKAKLSELIKGTRPEEIEAAEIKVANAQKSLEEAQKNLENVKAKAKTDLANLYSQVNDILHDAFLKAQDAVIRQTDEMFFNDETSNPELTFNTYDSQVEIDVKAQRILVNEELKAFKSEIDNLTEDETIIEQVLEQAKSHLNVIRNFLIRLTEAVEKSIALSQTTINIYKSNLNNARTEINSALDNLSRQQQLIATQKIININNIQAANISLTNAENNLRSAQAELTILQSGTREEEIRAQEAQVKQAETNISQGEAQIKQAKANLESIQAQLAKTILRAPISGIITKREIEKGEIATANKPIFTLISTSPFEIEVNIPEADIAKVNIGNEAKVTLDAYGSETIFKAKVVSIDPGETVLEGVATYRTILHFLEDDKRIRPGLTANVEILTDKRENVIAIPWRAIMTKDGEKFVRVLEGNEVKEVKVKTGLQGSDGNVEIIEGIREGDKVIVD